MLGVIWVLGHRGPFSFCIVRTKDLASLTLLRVSEVKVGMFTTREESHTENKTKTEQGRAEGRRNSGVLKIPLEYLK